MHLTTIGDFTIDLEEVCAIVATNHILRVYFEGTKIEIPNFDLRLGDIHTLIAAFAAAFCGAVYVLPGGHGAVLAKKIVATWSAGPMVQRVFLKDHQFPLPRRIGDTDLAVELPKAMRASRSTFCGGGKVSVQLLWDGASYKFETEGNLEDVGIHVSPYKEEDDWRIPRYLEKIPAGILERHGTPLSCWILEI